VFTARYAQSRYVKQIKFRLYRVNLILVDKRLKRD
jgi:hypothetical protein